MVDRAIGILSSELSAHVIYKQEKKEQLRKEIEDIARDCFNAARETENNGMQYKHKSFDDFLKTMK